MEPQEKTTAIESRLDRLDYRMQRIEKALNRILELFGQPKVDSEEEQEHGLSVRSNTSDSWTEVTHSRPEAADQKPKIQETSDVKNDPDAPFSYHPIDSHNSQIRVLALQPSTYPDAPITAELWTQSLDEEAYSAAATWRPYSALSYTWGESVFSSTIVLDGKPFAVTQSLEAALRAMRSRSGDPPLSVSTAWPYNETSPTYYWIDQICIDQKNLDERNEQVALMRRIYKRASTVQVWLGAESDNSDTAMDLLTTLGLTPARQPGDKELVYPNFDACEVQKHWSALEALFRRAWWERAWIRQEVALSSSVTFVCGTKSVSLDALGPLLTAVRYIQLLGYEHRPSPSKFSKAVDGAMLSWPGAAPPTSKEDTAKIQAISLEWTHHAHSLLNLHRATNGGYTFVPLPSLFISSRACKATDPRDFVFSTLGLCDLEVYPIMADYRAELKDVLTAATRAVISKEHGLDVLGGCQNVERTDDLPSWVPNVRRPWKAMPFPTMKEGKSRQESTNYELRVTDQEAGDVQVEGECLILRGGLIDEIAMICEHSFVRNDSSIEELDLVFTAWKAFVTDAGKAQRLSIYDNEDFVDGSEAPMNWVRFLTVLQDDARDLSPSSREQRQRVRKNGRGDANSRAASPNDVYQAVENKLRDDHSYYHLNFKLIRRYLLPDTHEVWQHPDQRIHVGLRKNGPGRRLAITRRGFIALIPSEAVIEDTVALFQGATFPYVLRKYGGKKRHVLVGEAFVPGWTHGRGEEFCKNEWRRGLDAVIRLY